MQSDAFVAAYFETARRHPLCPVQRASTALQALLLSMASNRETKERPRTRTISIQLPTLNVIDTVTDSLRSGGTYILEKFRQASPFYIPLLICLAAIPLLMLLSLFAGWSVWKSVPTGWHKELYLQYG